MTSDDYILDDATVRDFIATVRERIERAGSPEEACEAIRPAFGELLADGEWLPAEYRREAPESGMGGGIGRWLLYRSGERSLSLFTLVVPPGTATPVHDHLAWGLGGLYQGEQDEEVYARRNPRPRARPAARSRPRRLLRPHPPRADIHRVHTTSEEPSVSIQGVARGTTRDRPLAAPLAGVPAPPLLPPDPDPPPHPAHRRGRGRPSFAAEVIIMSNHAATHVDAFGHYDRRQGAPAIADMPLDVFCGEAVCVDVRQDLRSRGDQPRPRLRDRRVPDAPRLRRAGHHALREPQQPEGHRDPRLRVLRVSAPAGPRLRFPRASRRHPRRLLPYPPFGKGTR
jgi:predicted metal-dependent enzyme (double-stranded beta helix superfamily)